MEIMANAKINLCLDVVKRREDGYHEMDMIMIPLALHDIVKIEIACDDSLSCDTGVMPMDDSNTMWKALKVMRDTFQFTEHFQMSVKKNIPMEAGMAGGSADAAAVMKGIWKLLSIPCSLEELSMLGKKIGADVPFCIINTCAIVQGIGERVTPFHNTCTFDVLLVKPDQGVSTKLAFELLDFTSCEHPQTLRCKDALMANDTKTFYQFSGNMLEQSALQLVPEITTIKTKLQTIGFPFVLMAGSGSTVFALCQDKDVLKKGYELMKDQYPFVEITRTC